MDLNTLSQLGIGLAGAAVPVLITVLRRVVKNTKTKVDDRVYTLVRQAMKDEALSTSTTKEG